MLLLVGLNSCKKEFEGDRMATQMPETFVVVDSVMRDPNNFLITTVQAFWWGSAPKGYVTGYEISTDGMQTWNYTSEQKGTFLLTLPDGVKKGEVPIFVRAIDNLGNKDQTPAQMVFPIENSAPRASIDFSNPLPDLSFPVIRFNWVSSDIDGLFDIDHYDIVWNDISDTTTYFSVPGSMLDLRINDTTAGVSVRIESQRSGNNYSSTCNVFQSTKTTPLTGTMGGLKFDTINYIYVRVVDKTGNVSTWIKDSVFIKKPVSDILLINCMYSNATTTQNFYLNNLAKPLVGINAVEVLRGVNSFNGNSELYTDALTQQRIFNLFKRMIWLTDDPNTLATAQLTTSEFFNAGGAMYIFAQFGDDFPLTSQVFTFTPIKSLVDPNADVSIVNGRFRMDNTCEALPIKTGWPILKYSGSIQVARPFHTNQTSSGVFSYDSIMQTVLRIQTSTGSPYWSGPSVTMSRRVKLALQKADMIISSLPLQNLNGNNNMDSMFKKIFIDELSF